MIKDVPGQGWTDGVRWRYLQPMWLKLTMLAVIEIALLGLLFLLLATNVGPIFYHQPHTSSEAYENVIGYMEVDLVWIGVLIYIPWRAYKTIKS